MQAASRAGKPRAAVVADARDDYFLAVHNFTARPVATAKIVALNEVPARGRGFGNAADLLPAVGLGAVHAVVWVLSVVWIAAGGRFDALIVYGLGSWRLRPANAKKLYGQLDIKGFKQ